MFQLLSDGVVKCRPKAVVLGGVRTRFQLLSDGVVKCRVMPVSNNDSHYKGFSC